jgi:signal peptidase II
VPSAPPVGPRPSGAGVVLAGLLLAAAVIAADQVTKAVAEATLTDGPVTVVGDLLRLRLTYNTGAAFSTATHLTEALTVLATLVSVALIVGILRSRSLAWCLALGLLLGGAVGNLIDRLTRDPGFARGAVVDFLELPRWPVFNLADAGVVLGAVTIVLLTLRGVPYRGADREAPEGR